MKKLLYFFLIFASCATPLKTGHIVREIQYVAIGSQTFKSNNYPFVAKQNKNKCAVFDGKMYCDGYLVYFNGLDTKPAYLSTKDFNDLKLKQ